MSVRRMREPPRQPLREMAMLSLPPNELGLDLALGQDELDEFEWAGISSDGLPYMVLRHLRSPEPGAVLWASPTLEREQAVRNFARALDLPKLTRGAYWVDQDARLHEVEADPIEEAAYHEFEHPRGRTGRWIPKPGRLRMWHLTDNPNFELDPDRAPTVNTTLGDMGANRKGLYVAPDLEPWFNGYDYVRPFAVEVEVPELDDYGGYSGENFLPAESFPKAEVRRVIPWDEYIREEYGEEGHFEDFEREGGTSMFEPPRRFPDYEYEGPDVRDMPPEEQERHKARARRYIEVNRPQVLAEYDAGQMPPQLEEMLEAEYREVMHPRDRMGRWIRKLGIPAWEVGGAVRDPLLGKEPKDVDYMLMASPEEIRERVEASGHRAEDLTVRDRLVGVRAFGPELPEEGVELAPPRVEVSTGPERTDFEIRPHPEVTPSQVPADQRAYIAEGAMKRGGFLGRPWHIPVGKMEDGKALGSYGPKAVEASQFASEAAGFPVRVIATTYWPEEQEGDIVHAKANRAMKTVYVKPNTDDLTILHEVGHLVADEEGHGDAWVRVTQDLYRRYLGDEAATVFGTLLLPDTGRAIGDDANRRDFTLNALYRDTETGELVDPTGRGVADAERGLLRTTSPDSFRDDPLRILRGLRFMSQHGLELEPETRDQMVEHADAVSSLTTSKGGVSGTAQEELNKLLLGNEPGRALRTARDTGVLRSLFPELRPMIGFDQESRYHDLPVDEHTFSALDKAAELNAPLEVRLALLFHDSGKPESAWRGKDGRLHYYGREQPSEGLTHEVRGYGKDGPVEVVRKIRRTAKYGNPGDLVVRSPKYGEIMVPPEFVVPVEAREDHAVVGARIASEAMARLNYPGDTRKRVRTLVEEHMLQTGGERRRARRVRTLRSRLGDEAVDMLLLHRRADMGAKGEDADGAKDAAAALDDFEQAVERSRAAQEPTGLSDLAIRGNQLIDWGVPPGPMVGQVLQELLDRVLADPSLNRESWMREHVAKRLRKLLSEQNLEEAYNPRQWRDRLGRWRDMPDRPRLPSPELPDPAPQARWRTKLGLPKLELKDKGDKALTKTQVHARVKRVKEAFFDFYGGGEEPEVHFEEEYLATVGSDARFRHKGEKVEGLLYGRRIMRDLKDPEHGVHPLRIIAHEAAHGLSGVRPGPLPGISQTIEEGAAEVLSLWFWHHRGQPFDYRDSVKVEGEWNSRLEHNVAYREETAEVIRRAASRVGWDREAIVDEVEQVMRNDHTIRLRWRDETDPDTPPPLLTEDDAVGLIRWLISEPQVGRKWAPVLERLHTLTKADVVAGRVPGVKFNPELPPGIAGRAGMGPDEPIGLGPGAFDDQGRVSSTLMAHEAGHHLAPLIIRQGKIPPEMAVFDRGGGRPEGYYGKVTGHVSHLFSYYEHEPFPKNAEEFIADAYSHVLHGEAEFNYIVGIHGPDDPDSREEERRRFEADPKTHFLRLVAAVAREAGLPDKGLYRMQRTSSGDYETVLREAFDPDQPRYPKGWTGPPGKGGQWRPKIAPGRGRIGPRGMENDIFYLRDKIRAVQQFYSKGMPPSELLEIGAELHKLAARYSTRRAYEQRMEQLREERRAITDAEWDRYDEARAAWRDVRNQMGLPIVRAPGLEDEETRKLYELLGPVPHIKDFITPEEQERLVEVMAEEVQVGRERDRANRDALLGILGEIRPMGGQLHADNWHPEFGKQLREVQPLIPTAWIEESNGKGEIQFELTNKRAHHRFSSRDRPTLPRSQYIEIATRGEGEFIGMYDDPGYGEVPIIRFPPPWPNLPPDRPGGEPEYHWINPEGGLSSVVHGERLWGFDPSKIRQMDKPPPDPTPTEATSIIRVNEDKPDVLMHELGHRFEAILTPELRNGYRQLNNVLMNFLEERTRGEPWQKLNEITKASGYEDHEVSRPDKFFDPYVGKSYVGGTEMGTGYKPTEVLTMGLQYLWFPLYSRDLSKDPEHRNLTLGLLATL